METGALAVVFLLVVATAPRVAGAVAELPLTASLVSVWLGFTVADLVSGMAHWFCDTWGRTSWSIVGNGVIRTFREHHVDPTAITRHDFVETNGSVAVGVLPLFAWAAVATAHDALILFVASFACALLGTNQIHKWAHEADPPRLARTLQSLRLILSPAGHQIHHTPPFDRHYCITTGWWNGLLGRIGFFRILDRGVSAITGRQAREEEQALRRASRI